MSQTVVGQNPATIPSPCTYTQVGASKVLVGSQGGFVQRMSDFVQRMSDFVQRMSEAP